jgi:N-(5-amino-5-carboxypentanoyl)-L-cysteinyl-D-valine synthase
MQCAGGHIAVEIRSLMDKTTTARFADELRMRLEQIVTFTTRSLAGSSDKARSQAHHNQLQTFDPFVVAHEHAIGSTLFVLPPGEGGAESYLNNLAKHLSGLRLVLFNNVHLHSRME